MCRQAELHRRVELAVLGEPTHDALVGRRSPRGSAPPTAGSARPPAGAGGSVIEPSVRPLDESGGRHRPVDRAASRPDPALPGPRPARPPRRRSSTPGGGAPAPSSPPGPRAPGSPRSLDRSPPWQPTGLGRGHGHGRASDAARPARRVVRHGGHGPPVRAAVRQPEHARDLAGVHHEVSVADADQLPGRQEPVHVQRRVRLAEQDQAQGPTRRGRARSRARIRAGPASRSGTRRAPPSTVRGRSAPRRARRGRGSGPGRTQDLLAPVGGAARPPPAGRAAAAARPGRVPLRLARGSARRRWRRGGAGGPGGDAQGLPSAGRRGHHSDHPSGACVQELVEATPRQRPLGYDGNPCAGARPGVELGTSKGEAHGDLGHSGSTGTRDRITGRGEVASPIPRLTPGDLSRGRPGLDQLVPPRERDGFLTRVGPELAVEGLDVGLDRVGRHVKC